MATVESKSAGMISLFLIMIGLFFPIYIIVRVYFGHSLVNSAFATVIVSFLIFELFLTPRSSKDKRKESTKNSEDTTAYSRDEKIEKKVNIGKEDQKKGSFLDTFKRKKTCDTCGTELEYKEEVGSYYCPECHEYK